jgi:hypothetical protein
VLEQSGHSSSIKKKVTGAMYLDMLNNYDVPQVPDKQIFQQDEASHLWTSVIEFLNE